MFNIKVSYLFQLAAFFSLLCFTCFAQAVSVPINSNDLVNINNEITHPFQHLLAPIPFDEETTKQALFILERKNKQIKDHYKALQIFNKLSPEQISRLLNEKNLILFQSSNFQNISDLQLKPLYEQARASQILSFILDNQLSHQHILILLLPILRDNSLGDAEVISILKESDFDLNTLIKVEDIAGLFLFDDTLLDAKDLKKPLVSVREAYLEQFNRRQSKSNNVIEALKEAVSNLDLTALFENQKNEAEVLKAFQKKQDFLDPEIAVSSLAHIAMANHRVKLIKFLYENKKFNPQIVNHAQQTPLHSAFIHDYAFPPHKSNPKDWPEILDAVFNNKKVQINSKDIHGLTPLAIAIQEGHEKVLPLFLDNPDIDLLSKDNYNRSLVIITSRSKLKNKKDTIRQLVEKAGDTLITPSHFNDYLSPDLESIRIKSLHPLQEIILRAGAVIKEDPNKQSNSSIMILQEYNQKIHQSLTARRRLKDLLDQSKGTFYEQAVIEAVKQDNVSFFEKFYDVSYIRDFLTTIFAAPVQEGVLGANKIKYVPSYHLLLSAIMENSPRTVEFLIENIEELLIFSPEPNENNPDFFYMDPLSEALVIPASLILSSSVQEDPDGELKKSSRIIDIIINHHKINFQIRNFMDLTPMEIAFLTGQLEQVKKLEGKGVSIPEGVLWNTNVTYNDIIEKQGFKNLPRYVQSKKSSSLSSCKNVFN